jgi:hypothetical protein
MATSTNPAAAGRRWQWTVIACMSIWLWLWTFWAWEIDTPSAIYVIQNLKATGSAMGDWLFASFYWVIAASVVMAGLLAWCGRYRGALAAVGFMLPSVLLTAWYVTEELPARRAVMEILRTDALLQALERNRGDVPGNVLGD